jgi:hypothetical protein
VSALKERVWETLVVLVQFAFYWNIVSAHGAFHVVCKFPFGYVEAVAFDNCCITVRAICVLGCMTGHIADVNVV